MTTPLMSKEDIVAAAGKVAVLMGGPSAEREISLKSGDAVTRALRNAGVDATALDWNGSLYSLLDEFNPSRIFVALHGQSGEDGKVQGFLETLGLPYTGSGVLASAIGMDKVKTKQLWRSEGLATPDYRVLRAGYADSETWAANLSFPLAVKPVSEGSSLGVTKVNEKAELVGAIEAAFGFGPEVLLEQWITGGEYTLSILGELALPIIKLETPHEFYDYAAKYFVETTSYQCPSDLDGSTLAACTELGLRAFHSIGASGWGRVDFMLDEHGSPWLIEVNTVPGMTDHSLVPMAAAAAGIDFESLVLRILATSMVARC